MEAFIAEALEMAGVPPIEEYRYSNFAVEQVLGGENSGEGMLCLGGTYEDKNLHTYYSARGAAQIINQLIPGRFVMIRTGDYIISGQNANQDAEETYDARHEIIIVTREKFTELKTELDRVDNEWRTERMRLAQADPVQPKQTAIDLLKRAAEQLPDGSDLAVEIADHILFQGEK